MGDSRRFSLFADFISRQFPDRRLDIADVAAGKGGLKAALYLVGYRRVTAWDRRHKLAKPRPGQRFQLFDHRSAPRGYRLVVGMHPDQATDEIILYAAKHRVPFAVCPCCVLPSGTGYAGRNDYDAWVRHLTDVARAARFRVDAFTLPMNGRNGVLVGRPEKERR